MEIVLTIEIDKTYDSRTEHCKQVNKFDEEELSKQLWIPERDKL